MLTLLGTFNGMFDRATLRFELFMLSLVSDSVVDRSSALVPGCMDRYSMLAGLSVVSMKTGGIGRGGIAGSVCKEGVVLA